MSNFKHLKKILNHGGLAFLIVRFTNLNETYLLLGEDLITFISNNERKSIPLDFFKKNAYKIELKYSPRLDYIKILNKIISVKEVD